MSRLQRTNPTPEQITNFIARKTDLSGADVADLLCVDPRTVRKWISGDRAMPWTAWFALRVLTCQHPDWRAP